MGTVVFGGKQLPRGGRSRFVSRLFQTPHIVTVIINSILIDIKTVLNYFQACIIIVLCKNILDYAVFMIDLCLAPSVTLPSQRL